MLIRRLHFPKVSIIVLTFNALAYIKQCLASIKKYSKGYELIVVDNGSQLDTVKWLKEQSGIRKIFNSQNRGFAEGNNQGIKVAKGEYILLLNSDTVVTEDWLPRLMQSIEKDNNVGIVGPYSNYRRGEQWVSVSYASLKEMHIFAKYFNRKEKETYHISGFCMMIKRRALNKIGLFDERFKVGNFEDVDYCIRAMRLGFKLKAANCFIHHYGSRSFMDNINSIEVRQPYHENLNILIEKWPYGEIKRAMLTQF